MSCRTPSAQAVWLRDVEEFSYAEIAACWACRLEP